MASTCGRYEHSLRRGRTARPCIARARGGDATKARRRASPDEGTKRLEKAISQAMKALSLPAPASDGFAMGCRRLMSI
ncbi:MAG TPA: hypothetical protein DCO86_01200 [Spirochaetaceae bacterium]|nr:hypothetical protein [Spirochaetaceae bacterium]